ncbi:MULTISPECIES: 3-hydroxyacyl-CoA dehydrogenase [unclassified Marinobacterium]|uniref:3-hydroxyacyl-CoA dehydrogenase n=1 Tax=unclassified Marinobacterium TaxID=2644139 RepID=UPI0019FF684E|nr:MULTISPECIES: 3-hydroxyacyl-CoA dehydrogenase [unclassified Marinobacterium]NRP52945.1 3-hydroxyadipyl-CoA dehydrogenase [Marinobacterium sp. xm-v-242]NRP77526.1 3-hydroxyadipyl-CoA dehydrogenase [Marinobacterium sp. xm-m-383]
MTMATQYKTVDQIKQVGVVGAGTMGAGIAQVASQAGLEVVLFDLNESVLETAKANLKKSMDKLVSRGKFTDEQAQAICDRITYASDISLMKNADLVVEAIVERLDIKQQLFQQLESICSDQTILATNTSSISVTAIGSALNDPARLAGLHFFNPAPIMKLVEVIHGLATDSKVIETLLELSKRWGKVGVAAKSSPGFIVNRVARPFYAEGLRLAEEGATEPERIDLFLKEAGGFRMGPFELTDLIGQDVNYAVTNSVFESYYFDPRFKPSLMQKELVDAGWLGRKSGRGFYQYPDGKQSVPNLEWDDIRFGGFFNISSAVVSPVIKSLIDRIKARGIEIPQETEGDEGEIVFANGATLVLTDGRTTLERSLAEDNHNLIQMDLAIDYTTCESLALSTPPEMPEEVWTEVYAMFDFLGVKTRVVKDLPGLVVMRTVAMLINEASDALHLGIADAAGIDAAMQAGVNYPTGLLAWADKLGTSFVADVLDNINLFYGDDRYRVSPALLQRAFINAPFHQID